MAAMIRATPKRPGRDRFVPRTAGACDYRRFATGTPVNP